MERWSMKRNKVINRQTKKAGKGKSRQKKSLYARKHEYLNKTGLWGFEVPSPKPWK